MAPKIFITGVTGYIGGDALATISKAHPEYEYTTLIRTEDKGKIVNEKYPSVRIVYGDLDNSKIIEEEASKADIVLHTADASDHEGAAHAIAKGLASGHSKNNPGYWLHTGGTGILTYDDSSRGVYGEGPFKTYNDWDGVEALTHLPDEAFHRNVDKIVLEAGQKYADSVKTVIVCPPTIYGRGRGPVSGRSRQAYTMGEYILKNQHAPLIAGGKAQWNNTHVYDLSDLFCLLVEAAAKKDGNPELWGARGYVLAENGLHVWGDFSKLMSKRAAALGFIEKDPEVKTLSFDQTVKELGFEAASWGLNSVAKAERARKVLGWRPHRQSLEDEVDEILKSEKARLDF